MCPIGKSHSARFGASALTRTSELALRGSLGKLGCMIPPTDLTLTHTNRRWPGYSSWTPTRKPSRRTSRGRRSHKARRRPDASSPYAMCAWGQRTASTQASVMTWTTRRGLRTLARIVANTWPGREGRPGRGASLLALARRQSQIGGLTSPCLPTVHTKRSPTARAEL